MMMRTIALGLGYALATTLQTPAPKADPDGAIVKSEKQTVRLEVVAKGLETPWGIAFLPDGRMLVTERPGRLRIVNKGALSAPVAGVPEVWNVQDGGLFDVEVHPDYARNGWIYLSYAEARPDKSSSTVIIRAKLRDHALVDQQVLFRGPDDMYTIANVHYGSRFAFDGQGRLFYSIGDKGRPDDAQDLSKPAGKIHRVNDDGSAPKDNPFSGKTGSLATIWSYGHRNSQGLALDPRSGVLWSTEHGPNAGDELNLVKPGRNYGWPIVSFGKQPGITRSEAEGMEPPAAHWTPTLAPGGIAFYTGSQYPGWMNNLFIGGLAGQQLRRVEITGDKVTHQEVVFNQYGRVRDIVVGPDGLLYAALAIPGARVSDTTAGVVVRLAPVAAAPAPQGQPQAPQFSSPEVQPDRRVAFRIYAPRAEAVRLSSGDAGVSQNTSQMTKAENGVWELTVGPLEPGAYRYNFNVDGVATIDPRNPAISESNNNVWSLVVVPGSDLFDTKEVPHGAVAEVTYKSTALGRFRRMHVYTPPGYEAGRERYPVFYLLHGAGDNDNCWSTVGRAGFILDNLIAAKKAKPMIVVMPAGHTSRGATSATARTPTEEFVSDFATDVMPYVEKNYRVLTGRANTAIAGLSMGGNHALQVAIPRLEKFGYIGVFSSGLLGAFPEISGRGGRGGASTNPPPTAAEWEKMHAAKLGDASLKKGLKVFWFPIGKEDFLLTTARATVDFFKKHGFTAVYKETPGGHTWINWRNYLAEFAPTLFK